MLFITQKYMIIQNIRRTSGKKTLLGSLNEDIARIDMFCSTK